MEHIKIREQLQNMSEMPISYNPYGSPLPPIFLTTTLMLKEHLQDGKPFGEYMQNGYITAVVKNDKNKTAPWEIENPVIFSEIRERLYKSNRLCVSNYLVEVLNALEKAGSFSLEYKVGMLCRSLRTFASFFRECELKEDIEEFMKSICRVTKKSYCLLEVTAKVDSKEKTDILLEYGDNLFRIWSYQDTPAGVNMTSHRILDDDGNPKLDVFHNSGFNLLMPFDKNGRKENCVGWYLYDKEVIRHTLINNVVYTDNVISSDMLYDMIRKNRDAVKSNLLFRVA